MQTLKKGFKNGASKDEMCNLEQFLKSAKKEESNLVIGVVMDA